MEESTIKTIRYALEFLYGVNATISQNTKSRVRYEQALRDMEKDVKAVKDFNDFVSKHFGV